jgi:hypothetical protein
MSIDPVSEDQHQKLKGQSVHQSELGLPGSKKWAENADPAAA